jgi:hypothetical protein
MGDVGAVIHQAEPDLLAKLYRDLRLQRNYRHSADGGKATATIGVVTSVSEGGVAHYPHACGSPLLKYCTAAARAADRDREVGRR